MADDEGVAPLPPPSSAAAHHSTARRTSIHLADRQLLRATTPSVLLGGIGRRMRGSVGGIGEVAESADDAYRKSFPVDKLDIFLSHSWHTWWLMKYLTLLYYFNAVPAIAAMSVSGLLFMIWHYHPDSEVVVFHGYDRVDDLKPHAQVIGSVTFIVTLLSWHHIEHWFRVAPTMFLDKVCIHQTDAALKVKGIKSIGAILANSKLMLVTWDSTYFERLWCTYEMSAFRKGNPDGRIKVLPVVLGPFVLSYYLATSISDLIVQGVEMTGRWTMGHALFKTSALIHLPMFILCMRVMARYINNLKKLKMQLASFSVRSAKCFCCDAKHIHPDTGAQLPCDREVVNNSIESWMGLDTFDRMVRGDFKRFVKRTLGGRARIPYRYAVAASIYPGLTVMDHMVAERALPWRLEVAFAFEAIFLRHPLIIALSVAFLLRYQDRMMVKLNEIMVRMMLGENCAKWALYTITGMLLSALHYVFLLMNSAALAMGDLALVIWLLFEIFSTASLYFGGILFLWRTPMAMWNVDVDFNHESHDAAGNQARESMDLRHVRSTLGPGRSSAYGPGLPRSSTMGPLEMTHFRVPDAARGGLRSEHQTSASLLSSIGHWTTRPPETPS